MTIVGKPIPIKKTATSKYITTPDAATGRAMVAILANNLTEQDFYKLTKGNIKKITIKKGVCYPMNGAQSNNILSYKSVNGDATATFTVESNPIIATEDVSCTINNPAGKTGQRPILTLNENDILEINDNKQSYIPTGRINQPLPASNAEANTTKNILTLYNDNLKVSLKTGASGVVEDVYTVLKPSDYIVTLPLSFSGDRDDGSTNVVSAIAKINGEEKYGILEEIGKATSQDVKIDLRDFSDNPDSLTEIKLQVFQESSGIKQTSYRGESKEITIKLETPKEQEISFDENMPLTAVYGDKIELSAHLTSSVNEQANTNITYSIQSGNASIASQSYNATTGKAVSVITPTNGEGSIVVTINKAGGTNIHTAEEKTLTITLQKKERSISPTKMNKIFQLNDPMLTPLTSDINGLLKEDNHLVENIVPVLSPLSEGTASRPDSGGVVVHTGIWKLVYLDGILDGMTELNSKYNVTLQDYDDDSTFIFETAITDIPNGWIVIEPDANVKGWNNTNVLIKPSEEAIQAGYDRIEVMTEVDIVLFGNSITYDKDTTGVTPEVRLCKGIVCTNTESAPREIKIDKTLPATNVSVENENGWSAGKKQVTIRAMDVTSGVASVEVVLHGTTAKFNPIKTGDDFVFDANQNGTYDITIKDEAGNIKQITKEVTGIDTSIPTLQAILQTKPDIPTYQDIVITWDAGNSSLKNFEVYYKQSDGMYLLLESLTPLQQNFTYVAEMNGDYKFKLTNKANQTVETMVSISGLTPPHPDTLISAVYEDETTQSYTSDTWTNRNIILSFENVNNDLNVEGVSFTWKVSEDNGNSWADMGNKSYLLISTDTYLQKTYLFKAIATKDGDIFEENDPSRITIKIDKRKPNTPTIKDGSQYTEDVWFQDDVTIESSIVPKGNGIQESIYVCENTKEQCEKDSSLWNLTSNGSSVVSENGKHEFYFKTIDEAGNESDISVPAYVNISDAQPDVGILLNDDPILNFLSHVTFGYFFKDTVKVDVDVTYKDGTNGKTYIIIDESGSGMPEENDPAWGNERTSTTIDPNHKAMIYVKVVTDAGVVVRESSVYDVYVDNEAIEIVVPSSTNTWMNNNSLEIEFKDNLSGVDTSSLYYEVNGTNRVVFDLMSNQTKTVLKNLKNGSYTIDIHAQDQSGNAVTKKVPLKIDMVLPVVGEPESLLDEKGKNYVEFTASDALSDIDFDKMEVVTSDGEKIDIKKNKEGTYCFTPTINDTYTIKVYDQAGNLATRSYIENNLDIIPPVIDDIVIHKENDWTINKSITFTVNDNVSQANDLIVKVTYLEEGETKTAVVNGPDEQNIYSFIAPVNNTYLISAEDKAGNITEETVAVGNIDPNGLKIVNISDLQSWTKDDKLVSFEVRTATSTIASEYPKVTKNGKNYPVTLHDGKYEFIADTNDVYTIEVENTIGDHITEMLDIKKIDIMEPSIHDVSENTSAEKYREPQTITFFIHDYNNLDHSSLGSGLKAGYPKIYYNEDGKNHKVDRIKDLTEPAKYSFVADKNTTYYVETMDEVEHDVVTKEIVVDHIRIPEQTSEIEVIALNNGNAINSVTWVKGEILFSIYGGVEASVLESYQFAITDGSTPNEDDWEDINMPESNAHRVTGDINGKSYWFRALPVLSEQQISMPFIVNLDNTRPENVQILKINKNTNAIAKFINAISFGSWLNQSQEIYFQAEDNFSTEENLRYIYAEEENGICSDWKTYEGYLTYDDVDRVLYVKAIDLAGNESDEVMEVLMIDTLPPTITGVKDKSMYKQYYLPRLIKVQDAGSGINKATYTRNNGTMTPMQENVVEKILGEGEYSIYASDQAGNAIELSFTIVPLPDIDTEIDGSDASKDIIDQIQKELDEVKEGLTPDEINDYEQWIEDATKKWEDSRKKVIETEDKTAKIEGIGDTDFDPKVKLIVEKVENQEEIKLPRKALAVYDVYLKKGDAIIQPNGDIKVYLPYDAEVEPIVYQIDEDGTIKEINAKREGNFVTFTTKKLMRYAISNVAQEETICKLDGVSINMDTDEDGLPDLNVDIDHDCSADLNIDMNDDQIPDIQIDTTGDTEGSLPDGKADINIDVNMDGKADINIAKITTWKPDLNAVYKDVSYDTMGGILPEVNIDVNGDGLPDYNIDSDSDGIADTNLLENTNQDMRKDAIGSVTTGDSNKWTLWFIALIVSTSTLLYSIHKEKQKRR